MSKNAQSLFEKLAHPGHYFYVKLVNKYAGSREEFYLLRLTGNVPDETPKTRDGGQILMTQAQFCAADRTLIHPRIARAVMAHAEVLQNGFIVGSVDEDYLQQATDEPIDFFWFRAEHAEKETPY